MSTAPDELETFYQFAADMRKTEADAFSLDRAYQAYRNQKWEAQTSIARKLQQLRSRHLAEGGKFETMTPEELDSEVATRRGSLGS